MIYSKIISQSPLDFISVDMAKRQLGIIDDSSQDAHITMLVEVAMVLAEKATKRILSEGVITLSANGEKAFMLPYGEADVMTSVQVNGEDVSYTFDAISQCVTLDDYHQDPVIVTYSTGYAAGEVPRPIQMGTLMLISTLYENREDTGQGVSNIEIPLGSRSLFDSCKWDVI